MHICERIINKPVSVLIVFSLLIMLGIYCWNNLSVDMYPETSYPMIQVTTAYPNASPEDVEQNVTRVLETGLSGVTGLKHISSTSSIGFSVVSMEFETGTNLDEAANSIRDKIDHVRSSLPQQATSPVTTRLDASLLPIMTLALKGNRTAQELYEYADSIIAPSLEQIDGIASADIVGGRERAVIIDIPRDRLEAYSLSITQIAQLLSAQNNQSSAGTIESNELMYSVSATGAFASLDDIRNSVIAYRPHGKTSQVILLRDIADVYEGTKKATSLAFLDGSPCVIINLKKQSGKNSVAAAHSVRTALKNIEKKLPKDVQIIETSNNTDQIESTINEVIKSVGEGAVLAIIVLFIFLRNIKSTVIIGFSIPVSIIITFVFMYFRGTTLNMISLAGLLIGVGMLVDNSIVVLENIYTHAAKGKNPKQVAIDGVKEMVMPVISSTLTSVCIFLPMLAFSKLIGILGEAFLDLGFTISIALVCSLATSIVLVPVLAGHYLKVKPVTLTKEKKSNDNKILNIYGRIVELVLRHRFISFVLVISLLVISFISISSRGFIYMPVTDDTTVSLSLSMPKGTKLSETESVIKQMEAIAKREIDAIKFSNITVGSGSTESDSNKATLTLTLNSSAEKAKEKLRPYFNSFPGAEFSFSQGFSLGGSGGYSLEIRSQNLEALRSTAEEIKMLLQTQGSDFITEVKSDITEGMPEMQIKLDRQALYNFGLTVSSITSELRASVSGITAGVYTSNGKDQDIIISLNDKDKQKLSDLQNIFVTNNNGQKIPLSSVAWYEESKTPSSINRKDQTRIATIKGVPVNGVTISEVSHRVNALIAENIPLDDDVTITTAGDYSDMMEQAKGFLVIILMAILLVFGVMASQFESFKDPFIIYFTLPFSFIGVAAIYAFTNSELSILSILGVLMLVGVIVNNGIVLVDTANSLRKDGMELMDACITAAKSRLRPIIMSTLTTIISLVPMALFPNEGTELIQPINLTVLGGLGVGTLMTLFIMPAVYYTFNKRGK